MKTAFVASLVAPSLADDVVSMLAMHVASRSTYSDAEKVRCLGQLDCAPSASTIVPTTGGLVLGPDWYKPYEGKNCFPGSGASIDGIENDLIGGHNLGLTPIECEAACDADPLCTCFTRSRDGKCWKRNDCQLEACADEEEFDTYIVMESLKYNFAANKNCYSGKGATHVDNEYVGEGFRVSTCKAACNADSGCNCVTIAKSSGKCWKRKDCVPDECSDADWADTYFADPPRPYIKRDGRNCHADAGATSRADGLDFVGGSLTVEECQAACDVDASCTCVTMHTSGACWKRESCTPNDCDIEQEGFDSWTVDM